MQIFAFLIVVTPSVWAGEIVSGNLADEQKALETIQNYYQHQSESICSENSEKVAKVITTASSITQKDSVFGESVKSADVIVAGEIHLYTDLAGRLDLIRAFSDQHDRKGCLAFEWPARPDGLDGTLRDLKAMSASDRKIGGRNLVRADNIDRMVAYYEPMANLAKLLGLVAATVDDKDRQNKDLSMDERNGAMASNIDLLIRGGRCSSVLMFAGKDHIAKSADATSTLPELLRKKAHHPVSINIQMTDEASVPGDFKTWSGCPAPTLKQYAFFRTADIPGDPLLMPTSGEEGRWKDFDFTLLVPGKNASGGMK